MKYRESLMVLGLLTASCSSSEPAPKEKPPEPGQTQTYTSSRYQQDSSGQPGVKDAKLTSTSARVEAIDQAARTITLKGPQGSMMTIKVGERVKNLSQIHVGDRVVVDYFESMAIQVVKPGTTTDQRETLVDSADPGDKPSGAVVSKDTMTATIEQIDRSVPSITLKDKDGNFHTVRVRHPERLDLVKIGDTLKITYTQAVAASVEPAPPAAE